MLQLAAYMGDNEISFWYKCPINMKAWEKAIES